MIENWPIVTSDYYKEFAELFTVWMRDRLQPTGQTPIDVEKPSIFPFYNMDDMWKDYKKIRKQCIDKDELLSALNKFDNYLYYLSQQPTEKDSDVEGVNLGEVEACIYNTLELSSGVDNRTIAKEIVKDVKKMMSKDSDVEGWTPKKFVEHFEQKKLDDMDGEPNSFTYEEVYNLMSGYASLLTKTK